MIATLAWLIAYSSPASYPQPTVPEGGGGGRYFTGSPADGFTCGVCHAGADPLELRVEGLPIGGWEPGLTYEIEIGWDDPDARASLLTEITLADGSHAGELALAPAELLLPEEHCAGGPRAADLHEPEDRQIASIEDCGARLLRMQWTAPSSAEQDVWFYLAGVHAQGAEGPEGDGVMVRRVQLPGPSTPASGCAVDGSRSTTAGLLGLLALGLLRRRQMLAPLLLLLTCACARVQPHERGRLAKPDMQMEIEAELCAGRNHAIEYREGSVGGMGGAGGGCGCN